MIRILHIFHEISNGGTGHFVMNYYRHIDRSQIQFDFLTSVPGNGYFDEEILKLGGKLYHAYPLEKNPLRNYQDIARIVKENHYQIVHRHTGSAFGYWELRAAIHGGAEHIILHAHSTYIGKPVVHFVAKSILRIDCHCYACSYNAGRFLFGEKKKFEIIPNAIDTQNFAFRHDIRQRIRQELGISNRLVIGHIGRFQESKNHKKLLSVFTEVYRRQQESVLVCVGQGETMEDIKTLAKRLGIEKSIIFLGQRNDVGQLLSAFDLFLFPSLYEGLGIALIEAQVNGLKCFVSKEAISPEVNITGNLTFISLEASNSEWADSILKADLTRDFLAQKRVEEAGYDINVEAEKLVLRYQKMLISGQ